MLCFIFCGLYKEINKYLGFRAILNILKSVAIGSLAFILFVLFVHHTKGFPRSIYFIDTILAFTFLSGFRFFKRIIQEGINVHIKKFDKRILIVGAGDAGHRISNEIHREQINKSIVLAFVDDDPLKHNLKINGVPVLGNTKSIENIVSNKNINEIIIAIANISDIDLKNIVNECEKTKANIKNNSSFDTIN
jgi:FlaA1/EpsC-like NDP-sugar epimerase